MDKKITYTIAFADGTSFGPAELNGNNYVVSGDVSDAVNAASKKSVTVDGSDGSHVEFKNATVNANVVGGDTYLFIEEESKSKRYEDSVEARLTYLEMMIGGTE
jgi:hypothetical protein